MIELILRQIRSLGQIAYSAHEDLERWRVQPMTGPERTQKGNELKTALEEQSKWIGALEEYLGSKFPDRGGSNHGRDNEDSMVR